MNKITLRKGGTGEKALSPQFSSQFVLVFRSCITKPTLSWLQNKLNTCSLKNHSNHTVTCFPSCFSPTEEYVTCHTCRSPDTILQKETRLFFIQCETCGSRRSVASIKSGFQAITQKRAQLKSKQQWSLMFTIYYCYYWTVPFIWFTELALKTMMKKRILCLHYRYSMKAKIVKRLSTDVLKNISIVFNENWTCHLNTKKDNLVNFLWGNDVAVHCYFLQS